MQLYYDDEGQKSLIRGDFIKKSVIRTDLVPIPITLEAQIRIDSESSSFFEEGKKIYTEHYDELTIVKSEPIKSGRVQGDQEAQFVSIIAVLAATKEAAFIMERAIIKQNSSLAAIYRSVGCSLKQIEGDFAVPYFACFAGEAPTFHIGRILQENGGVMRWKDGKLSFIPLRDLFTQEPVTDITISSGIDINSGFLERHDIPTYYSIDDNGNFIFGNRAKARKAKYVAGKDEITLRNMSRCLILAKTLQIAYNNNVVAGDLVQMDAENSFVVITSASVFAAGTDGDPPQQYTKLWLGVLYE